MAESGTSSWITAARAGRHVVREFTDGAVLIDLDSGDLMELNRTAAFIYAHLTTKTTVEEIVGPLSDRFGITRTQAFADISVFFETTPKTALVSPIEDPSPFEYVPSGETFAVCESTVPRLYVHRSGQWFTPASDGRADEILAALVWAIPKILVLQGYPVLHASAVAIAGRAVAFSGRSGAGKTTLARAFADGGAALVAEDGLLVHLEESSEVVGITPLESGACQWALRALRGALKAGSRIACDVLPTLREIPALPLGELMFLDARRRQGTELQKLPLGQTARAVALLQNLFWASNDVASYASGLAWTASISRLVPASQLTVPAGILQLTSAARTYVEKTAS